MPVLPDVTSLGQRPVPVSQRSIASNPRAGVVGDALAGFGQRAQQIGERVLQQAREKEDKLAYASARSALLTADITARRELADDPDYSTWETRYNEKMSGALGQAAQSISSSADRALFEQDGKLDILRGSAELATTAHARHVDTEIGAARDTLFQMQDLAQDAPDDASREAVIGNADDLISGLQAKGYIGAKDAGDMRREWTQNYVVQRIETLRNVEDYAGAQKFFEANRGRLDAATESRVANLLTDALDNREALVLGEQYAQGNGARATQEGTPPAPAPAMSSMVAITARAESGSRERDSAGNLITSPAGAQGRMQVMPSTARDPGHGIRPWDGKTDEDRSRVGEQLLAALMEKYDNDPAKAWAAYNWGEGRVDNAIAQHGDKWLAHAPAETRAYVNSNVAALGTDVSASGPQRRDLGQIYDAIDADARAQGWTPEKTERVKAHAAQVVARDDTLINRAQDTAYEQALAKAETLGSTFTDPSQLGDAYYTASEQQQATLRNMAEANVHAAVAATAPHADGDVIRALHRMQIEQPGNFATADLRPYRPFMTPGEYDDVVTQQAKATQQEGQWSPRIGIQNAITWGKTFGGVPLEHDEDRYRVYRYMEDRAQQFRTESKGRDPAESDYQRWFGEATAETAVPRSLFGVDVLMPDTTVRAYQNAGSSAFRKQIIRDFRAVNGRDPTGPEIQQWFDKMGEAIQ